MNFGTLHNFSTQSHAPVQYSPSRILPSSVSLLLFSPQLKLNRESLAGPALLWWHVLLLAHAARRSLRRRSASKLAPLFPDFASSSPGSSAAAEPGVILHPTFSPLVRSLLRSLLRRTIFFIFGRGNDVGAMLPQRLDRGWRWLLWGLLANLGVAELARLLWDQGEERGLRTTTTCQPSPGTKSRHNTQRAEGSSQVHHQHIPEKAPCVIPVPCSGPYLC